MSLTLGTIWNNKDNKKIINRPPPKPETVLVQKPPVRNDVKKFWGTPTWYLFHGIAANINAEFYKNNYAVVFNFIKQICSNLPCPFCRKHAVNYINAVNVNSVNTKEKLEIMLFNFHNSVNSRTGKPVMQQGELQKYKTMNMVRCFELFKRKFFRSYYGDRTFSGWMRKKFEDYFLEFYKQSINYYN